MSSKEIAYRRSPNDMIDRGTFESANAAVGCRYPGLVSNVDSKYICTFGEEGRSIVNDIQVDDGCQ